MNVLANVTFDMQRPGYAVIYAVQGDRLTRQVNATLVNAGAPWTVPDGALMMIRYYKPDGTSGFYDTDENGDTAYTISGSSVTFTIAQQALAVVGNVAMQLNFYTSGGEALSSFPFIVTVQPSVYNDAEIISDDYYNVLIGTLSDMAGEVTAFQQAMEAGYGAPLKASTVAGMTDHSKVYVYTGSESGYVAGNWYYWNGSAWTSGGVYNAVAVDLDDTLTSATKPAQAKAVGDAVSELRSELYDNCLNVVSVSCDIANGTLVNPNNANGVNTTTHIPCSYGDIVTLHPNRINASGYHYVYTYRIYDSSDNVLASLDTSSDNNNPVTITKENAAYIRFAIFEYDGTNYNQLRANNYGSKPYAYVQSNISVSQEVNNLNDVAEAMSFDYNIEIGTNRFIQNNTVVSSAHAARASFAPIKPISNKATIIPYYNGLYGVTVYAYINDVWSELKTNIHEAFTVDLSGASLFFCQARCDTDMEENATPFVVYMWLQGTVENLQNEIDKTPDIVTEYFGEGYKHSVELANGTMANASNANAVNTSSYTKVSPGMVATCEVNRAIDEEGYSYYFAYALYDSEKTLIAQDTTSRPNNDKIVIPYGVSYIRYAIFETDGNDNFIQLRTSNVNHSDIFINLVLPNSEGIVNINEHKKEEAAIIKLKKTSNENYGECDAKFLFITDVHNEVTRLERCVELANAWGTSYVSSIINGGDTVRTTITESLNWYNTAISGLSMPILPVIGNHDAWNSLGTLETDPKVPYNALIAPIASSSGIVQPTGAAANGYNYYYKDYNSTLRVVFIDCMYWDSTELSWFESVLADARTNNLHVIAVSHASFPWTDMTIVDCLWSKAGMLDNYSDSASQYDPTRTPIAAANAVKDFMDAGGVFVCWLTGHQHGDDVHKLTAYGDQFVVTMGSFAQRASMLQKNDLQTAYNYDCLTYIAVDTTNKAIKFLRIGADIDMYGVKHNGLSIDYHNKKLIASW